VATLALRPSEVLDPQRWEPCAHAFRVHLVQSVRPGKTRETMLAETSEPNAGRC